MCRALCSPRYYLVDPPVDLSPPVAGVIFALGCLSIWINYDADRQRQFVRQKKGECLVWGKPPTLVRAKYTTTAGEERESLLLASGWWGVSRHFHYIPEITASFFWCSPALTGAFYPYFYVLYLTILLTDRAFR